MWDSSQHFTRIKLCEFESLDAAYEASGMGVDALGFHVFGHQDVAKRVELFQGILTKLPRGVEPVLLCDLEFAEMSKVVSELSIGCVQLYPDWSPCEVTRLRLAHKELRIMKVVSAQPHENQPSNHAQFFAQYDPVVDGYLLDSFRQGGTGEKANWDHCAKLILQTKRPVFLAGGLTVENVADAIRKVRPFGVDVESGVSTRLPDRSLTKNMIKCQQFVDAVTREDRRRLRNAGAPSKAG